MTTAARQNLGSVLVVNSIEAFDDAHMSEVDAVELRAAPLLRLACADPILFQKLFYFGFPCKFFCVQAGPNPHLVLYRVAVSSAMSSVNALAVIDVFVSIVVTFRARLQRRIQGTEVLSSMFGVARGATDTGSAMGGNDTSHESFSLMTGRALGMHLFSVPGAYAGRVTGRA